MKVLVIGGVAAGTKAAAKLKRCSRDTEVKVITKSADISYAGCGLPYYIGGSIGTREELIVNTPEKFEGLTGVEVVTETEATSVNVEQKTVTVKDKNENTWEENYDKLIIATGAYPFVPKMEGTELKGVFTVRTPDDAIDMRKYVEEGKVKRAVVCGAGFIGLEVAENLHSRGVEVTVIDAAPQIMPNAFDVEMADYAKRKLREAGIRVLTSTALSKITGEDKVNAVETANGVLSADLVVMAIGIRPATQFLENSGIEMDRGTVVVNEYMETNKKDVYAVGDCALVTNAVTGKRAWSAMGSTANITGRLVAQTCSGNQKAYKGCLGTGVAKLLGNLNCGRTGLTEVQAQAEGIETVSVVCVTDDKAHYYEDASSFVTKLIANKETQELIGIQVFGSGAVDKMVDIAVVGINAGMKLHDFDTLDFAYAPPFSTAIHPFVTACYILENKMEGNFDTFTPLEYTKGLAKGYQVLDVQPQPAIPNAKWINLAEVNGPIDGLDKDAKLLLVCAKGKRGYFLYNRLKAFGYTNVKVLEGGAFVNQVKVERNGKKLSPLEIKRVKALGCLQDKRYDDVFNVRVITRNGKITTEEQMKIAEAAKKFGSGEITMTTRLTLEIQGVPYDSLEDIFAFLDEAGLETGGTGSKVRPVVSCKGTTCQYGLIDTFDLSEKIHQKFYKGFNDVALPHKFKIAVGGCPNNCVKPNLNDIGIVGQSVPAIDFEKCKGCKVCQVENACPLHVAKVVDGKVTIDANECNHCGRCITKCPFQALDVMTHGYKIYIGGRWGKKVAAGRPLSRIFTTDEEVMDMIEKAILFFRDEGISGERFADTIDRLGFEYVEDKLLNQVLDKETIMKKTVVGGATC